AANNGGTRSANNGGTRSANNGGTRSANNGGTRSAGPKIVAGGATLPQVDVAPIVVALQGTLDRAVAINVLGEGDWAGNGGDRSLQTEHRLVGRQKRRAVAMARCGAAKRLVRSIPVGGRVNGACEDAGWQRSVLV